MPAFVDALRRGWNPDNVSDRAGAEEQLQKIAADAAAFVDSLDDQEAKGPPFKLPDGTMIKRLPSFNRWIWDGEFCGLIGFRWQAGTSETTATWRASKVFRLAGGKLKELTEYMDTELVTAVLGDPPANAASS